MKSGREQEEERVHSGGRPASYPALTLRGDRLSLSFQTDFAFQTLVWLLSAQRKGGAVCLKHTFLCFLIHTEASVHRISLNRHAVCPLSVALRTSKNKRGINCPDSGAVSPGRLLGWRCEGPLGVPAPPLQVPSLLRLENFFPGKTTLARTPGSALALRRGSFSQDSTYTGPSVQLFQGSAQASSVRELQRCWQPFKVSLDSPPCSLRPGSSPAGETGSRRPAAAAPSMAEGWEPASGTGLQTGLGRRPLLRAGRGVKSHSTERNFLAPTESLGAGGRQGRESYESRESKTRAEVCRRAEAAGRGVRLCERVPYARVEVRPRLEAERQGTGSKPRGLERSRVNGLPGKK